MKSTTGSGWLVCLVVVHLAWGTLGFAYRAFAEEPTPRHRQFPPPRVLVLSQVRAQQMLFERLRDDLPIDATFLPWGLNHLDYHRVCDTPVRQSDADKQYAAARLREVIDEATTNLDRFDVVVIGLTNDPVMPARPGFEFYDRVGARIADWVRAGGRLIYIGPAPEKSDEEPDRLWSLADALPIKAGRLMRWTVGNRGATDHPLLRGLPMEWVEYRWYGRLFEPVDDTCAPLTRQEKHEHGLWHRQFPSGGRSVAMVPVLGQVRDNNPRGPDGSALWAEIFQRLFYGLTYGDRAYPAPAKVVLPTDAKAIAGQPLAVTIDVENRGHADAAFLVTLELMGRVLPDRIRQQRTVSITAGGRAAVDFEIPVDLPCVDEYLLLRALVTGEQGGDILGQSTVWLALEHPLPVSIQTDRPAYLPGQEMSVTIAAPAVAREGNYRIAIHRVDRQGRALEVIERQVNVSAGQPLHARQTMTMPDWDPELAASFWLHVTVHRAEDSGHVAGTAWTKVQSDRRWDMRQQLQFSVWGRAASDPMVRLMRDAGFNALGFPGNNAVADRYAMRQYVEGTGVDTARVQINLDSWEKVEAGVRRGFERLDERGPEARSRVIVSLGEEAGFGQGWGRRYYWEEETAPPAAQKMFGQYLAERYGHDIAALNRQWNTQYRLFGDIPLRKSLSLSKYANRVHLADQSWMAMDNPDEQPPPAEQMGEVESDRDFLGILAPYYETYNFFDDYYQRYCDLVARHYRARNPVGLTAMSLSSGRLEPKTDLPTFTAQGPHYNPQMNLVANAIARRDYGEEPAPGFSGVFWACFDTPALWNAVVLSHLLAGNTHLDYWVDVPLTFNGDLTHTRSSMWTRRLTRQLRPIEPILLHQRFFTTPGLAMYVPLQPLPNGREGVQFGYARNLNAATYSAMTNHGYFPRVARLDDLRDTKVLWASHAQVVTPDDGKALRAFVEAGGLLITDPMIASCNFHGNMYRVYPDPASGLGELLGFRLENTSQPRIYLPVKADLRQHLPVHDVLGLMSFGYDRVIELAEDVEVLAHYEDGQPLILRRRVGRGTVLHLNIVLDFGKSTWSAQREAFGQLIDAVLRHDGRVKSAAQVGFESLLPTDVNAAWRGMDVANVPPEGPPAGSAIPWWSNLLYTDPSGQTLYFAVFSHHISPIITATVAFPGHPAARIFDLFSGKELAVENGRVSLTLGPGDAALWAVTTDVPTAIGVEAPARLTAGDPLPLRLTADVAGLRSVRGMIVDVYDPAGHRSSAHSLANVQVPPGGADIVIPTALNDPPGTWRVVVTDSLTRLRDEKTVTIVSPARVPDTRLLRPFPPRHDEVWPTAPMTSQTFLSLWRRLRAVYDGDYQGLAARHKLSFFLQTVFEPESRHELVRRLHRSDWMPHVDAFAAALRDGERLYLTGEDLNRDEQTGQPIDLFASAQPEAFLDELVRRHGVKRGSTQKHGLVVEVYSLGRGRLVIVHDSADANAHTGAQFARWHERIKRVLHAEDH